VGSVISGNSSIVTDAGSIESAEHTDQLDRFMLNFGVQFLCLSNRLEALVEPDPGPASARATGA
jgi:hypothetical protein